MHSTINIHTPWKFCTAYKGEIGMMIDSIRTQRQLRYRDKDREFFPDPGRRDSNSESYSRVSGLWKVDSSAWKSKGMKTLIWLFCLLILFFHLSYFNFCSETSVIQYKSGTREGDSSLMWYIVLSLWKQAVQWREMTNELEGAEGWCHLTHQIQGTILGIG